MDYIHGIQEALGIDTEETKELVELTARYWNLFFGLFLSAQFKKIKSYDYASELLNG